MTVLRPAYWSTWSLLVLASAGCGSVMGQDYEGDALVSFSAEVIRSTGTPADSRLALVWVDPDRALDGDVYPSENYIREVVPMKMSFTGVNHLEAYLNKRPPSKVLASGLGKAGIFLVGPTSDYDFIGAVTDHFIVYAETTEAAEAAHANARNVKLGYNIVGADEVTTGYLDCLGTICQPSASCEQPNLPGAVPNRCIEECTDRLNNCRSVPVVFPAAKDSFSLRVEDPDQTMSCLALMGGLDCIPFRPE